jgi:hypothetical protein
MDEAAPMLQPHEGSSETRPTLSLLLGFNRVHAVLNTNYRKGTVSVRCHAVYSLS